MVFLLKTLLFLDHSSLSSKTHWTITFLFGFFNILSGKSSSVEIEFFYAHHHSCSMTFDPRDFITDSSPLSIHQLKGKYHSTCSKAMDHSPRSNNTLMTTAVRREAPLVICLLTCLGAREMAQQLRPPAALIADQS